MKQKRAIMITAGGLLAFVFLFTACTTYQAGITFEPRPDGNAGGLFFAGDFTESSEFTFVFYPEVYPQNGIQFKSDSGKSGMGVEYMWRYPFDLLNNRISLYPALGADFRYFQPSAETDFFDSEPREYLGLGFKFGGGFDVNITKSLFIRGKVLFTPGFLSFMQNESGFRLSFSFGYRLSPVRLGSAGSSSSTSSNSSSTGQSSTSTSGSSTTGRSLTMQEYADRGRRYLENGDYDRAIADFTEVIRLTSNNQTANAAAYALRGYSYRMKGDDNRAIADLDQAIMLDSKYESYFKERGMVYIIIGNFNRAIADFTEAIRLDPNDAEGYALRFKAYVLNGEIEKAAEDYLMAVSIDPNNKTVLEIKETLGIN